MPESLARRSTNARTPAVQDTVAQMIQRQQSQINRALPRQLNPDRFARIVLTEVKSNPGLLRCDPTSLLAAVMKAASLGVEPGPLGHVYLVPYKDQVQMILGYKGIIDLARRSGKVSELYAEVVYEGDHFEYTLGLHRDIQHWRTPASNRSKITHAYAVAKYVDGGNDFAVLDELDIESRRSRSGSRTSGPWTTDYAAMARKSAVKALAPYLPLTPEAAGAVSGDERSYDWDSIDSDGVEIVEPLGEVEHAPERPENVDEEGEIVQPELVQ